MASPEETARRAHWRAHFDPARPLAEQLDKPWIDMWQVAHIMGISEASAYKSAKRFHAAMLAVLKDKAVIDRLADLGFDPVAADGKVFGRLFDRTVDTFAGIARERSIAAGD